MESPLSLADIRKNYSLQELSKASVKTSPFEQFQVWLNEALAANVNEPTAMHLATASTTGKPSARVVLLKELSAEGFVFFTNCSSRKGSEINLNPQGAITFFWPDLERQVRIEGIITKIEASQSDIYFKSRPVGSQIGAWASPQSQEVPNREFLAQNEKNIAEKFAGTPIKRPDHWGGYVLKPDYLEFWQGRPNRLHDRIAYQKQNDNSWKIKRLAP